MSPHIRNIYEWRQSMKSNSRSLPRYLVSLELVLLAMASLSLGAQKHEADIRERLDASAAVLGQLITAPDRPIPKQDRKSTRLNSSHRTISYAVFCLKKKKKKHK